MKNQCKRDIQFVSTLEDYARTNPGTVSFLHQKNKQFYYSYVSEEIKNPAILHPGESRMEYVACIHNATCFAGSDLILLDKKNAYHEFKSIAVLSGKADCSDYRVLFNDVRGGYFIKLPKKKIKVSQGMFLSGLFSENYYHFVYSILSKTELLSVVPKEIPLLVDNSIKKFESYQALLKICNTDNRDVIFIDYDTSCQVGRLYLISTPSFLAPNICPGIVDQPENTQYDIEVLKHFRNRILSSVIPSNAWPKRIYISRKNASTRRPYNEFECQKLLCRYGFVVVFPEEMTFEQQVQMFSNAEFIVGCSGAAFTNILFCKEGCRVLMFIGHRISLSFWQPLACMNGISFFRIHDRSKGELTIKNHPYDIHNPFYVDPDDVRGLMSRLCIEQEEKNEVEEPLLDVVTVSVLTYNSSKTVIETLESVKSQSYPKIMLQICDDCSTDCTIALCKEWVERNRSRFADVKLYAGDSNQGVSCNCNRSLDICETTYMKEIAGDDTLEPNCIATFLKYAQENPQHAISFSRIKCFGSNSERLKEFERIPWYKLFAKSPSEQLHYLIYEGNCLPTASAFYNVDMLRSMKLRNDEAIPHLEDWPKWINYLKKGGTFGFVDEVLVGYRVGSGMSTSFFFQDKYLHSHLKFALLYRAPHILLDNDIEINAFVDKLYHQFANSTQVSRRLDQKSKKHLRIMQRLICLSVGLLLTIVVLLIVLL